MVLTLGMGALGAVLGLMIAWSASPVISTAMPLLFGLVGGAGSFSLLKMDLAKPGAQQRLKALGASLLSCCSACLVTLVVGAMTRGYVVAAENDAVTYQLSAEQLANPVSAVDRLLLRKRLVAIGASKSEIGSIIGAREKLDFKSAADAIGKAVTALLAAHDQLSVADQQKVDAVPGFVQLVIATRYFAFMKGSMDPAAPMTQEVYRLLTNNLYAIDFQKVLPMDPPTAKSFTDHPGLVVAVTGVSEAVRQSAAVVDLSLRTSDMDHLISVTANARSRSGDLGGYPFVEFWQSANQ